MKLFSTIFNLSIYSISKLTINFFISLKYNCLNLLHNFGFFLRAIARIAVRTIDTAFDLRQELRYRFKTRFSLSRSPIN